MDIINRENINSTFISEDKKTITLPVPLGTILYEAKTKCGDFCSFQKTHFYEIFKSEENRRCDRNMPCHTISRGSKEIEMSLDNISYIMKYYGKWIFDTKEQAEQVSIEIANSNRFSMNNFGFVLPSYNE